MSGLLIIDEEVGTDKQQTFLCIQLGEKNQAPLNNQWINSLKINAFLSWCAGMGFSPNQRSSFRSRIQPENLTDMVNPVSADMVDSYRAQDATKIQSIDHLGGVSKE